MSARERQEAVYQARASARQQLREALGRDDGAWPDLLAQVRELVDAAAVMKERAS